MVVTGAKALEVWARRVTQGYPNVHIMNMTSSWKNGLAFCAILHKFRPDLLDFSSLKPDQIERNCELVFNIAEKELQIPALLDPQDMATCIKPDRLSILTYLAEFYHKFKDQEENRSNVTKLSSSKSAPSLRTNLETATVTNSVCIKDSNDKPKQEPVCDNMNNNEDIKVNDVDRTDNSGVMVESRMSTELSRKDSGDSGVSMTSPRVSCSSPPPSPEVSCSSLPPSPGISCSSPQPSSELSCSSSPPPPDVSCSSVLTLSEVSCTSLPPPSLPLPEVSCSPQLDVEVSSTFETNIPNLNADSEASSTPLSSEVEDSALASITFTDESDCVFSSSNIDSALSLPTLTEEKDSLHVASIAFTEDSDCVFSSINDDSISSLPKERDSQHVATIALIDESDYECSSLNEDSSLSPSAPKLSGNSVSINVNGSVPPSSIVTISVPPTRNLQNYNQTAKPYKSLLEEVPSKKITSADNNSSVFITCDPSSSIVTCNSSYESSSSRILSDNSSSESQAIDKEISSTIKESKSFQRSSSGLNTLLKNAINKSNLLKTAEIEDYHSLPVHHESKMCQETVKPSSPLAARINKYEFLSPQFNKSPRNDWVLKSMCSPSGDKSSKTFDPPKNNKLDINIASLSKSNVPENKFGSLNRVGRSCTNPGFQSIRERFQRISLG